MANKVLNKFQAKRLKTEIKGESLTQQQFKDDCDINKIMERFKATGMLNHFNKFEGTYDDVPAISYTEAIETKLKVETMFQELPSAIRRDFDEDPTKFLMAINDPDNNQEILLKHDLIKVSDNVAEELASEPVTEPVTEPTPTTGS